MYLCAVNNILAEIMPRQERLQSVTGIYHVMLRGINKQDIFEDDEDYSQFLNILHALVNRCDEQGHNLPPHCTFYAYCLMTNHVHLLVREWIMRTVPIFLRKMENSSNKIVRKVFNDVANLYSGKEHVIRVGISDKGSFTTPKNSGGDSFIYTNYDYDKNHAKNGTTFTDYEILGHELKHAYDIQYYKNSRLEDEYKIVNFENLIRKEEGRPMRTNYDGHPIPDNLKGVITLW